MTLILDMKTYMENERSDCNIREKHVQKQRATKSQGLFMEGHESSQLASMLLVSLVVSAKGGKGLNESRDRQSGQDLVTNETWRVKGRKLQS